MSIFRFRADHPYRPVNWRYERARILKEYGQAAPGRMDDDEWTKKAARFRILKDKCKSPIEVYKLLEKYKDIGMAFELYDDESDSDFHKVNPARYEIEARILARESLELIAQKANLPETTIFWYEKLFFNVLDRIDNNMYIMHQVIGDGIQKGMTDRDYATLWKLYAYVRGSCMLDFLITTFSDWSKLSSADQVDASLFDDHRKTMRRKAALASRMLGLNGHTQDRFIELHTKIVEVEKASGEASPDDTNQNIQVMLSHLPFIVGKIEGKPDENIIRMPNNTGMAAGLRANEILNLSAGQDLPIEELKELKFPEKTDDEETN